MTLPESIAAQKELEGLEDVIESWGQRHYVCNKCGDAFTIASAPNHDDGGASLKTLACECGIKGDYKQVNAKESQ